MAEPVKHELRDVDVRRLLLFGAALCATVALSMLAMGAWFGHLAKSQSRGPAPPPLAPVSELPPRPRLQIAPHEDLEQKRRREDAILNSYGWVDPKGGVIRLPIDRAIELVAKRGIPPSPKGKK